MGDLLDALMGQEKAIVTFAKKKKAIVRFFYPAQAGALLIFIKEKGM
jgi:hypothetical protein